MFGSTGPTSPSEYLPPFNILDPMYYPSCEQMIQPQQQQQQPQQVQMDSSETDGHSSAPPTPDVISDIISLTGPTQYLSDLSSGSYGDMTSPEDYQSISPPLFTPTSVDVSRVQATRSKLIKEGLKLTIQSRRIVHGLDTLRPEFKEPLKEELTKEDEERRRRRRERNKVAATKCRNKKKERTGRLAVESETLEVNNTALRCEINSLERERKELVDLLRGHLPQCGLPMSRASCEHAQNGPTWPSAVLG